MTLESPERITLDNVDQSKQASEWKRLLADAGCRRHLSYAMDFDTRALSLEEPGAGWADEIRRQHLENQERTKARLAREFGSDYLERKIDNFISIGTKPFSVLAHHNNFFDQVRRSFVIGAYYPALVGACALGERILNHLVLDLREYYKNTSEYKKVYNKKSFDDWRVPICALEAWGVLLPKAILEFESLRKLRHRSIHFNLETYASLKEDALAAIRHMREIIDQQFVAFADRPWFIRGTSGHVFIKREWEENPFIKTYYLPTCPFVGPYFAITFEGGLKFHDQADYGDGDWTDEEFAAKYEGRLPEQIVKVE